MATKKRMDDLVIEGARLIFRNFSGKGDTYNREGDRNFNVIIEDELVAQKLSEDGWNIKIRPPREEGDEALYRLPVKVNYNSDFPPKIWLVTRNANNLLDEETVGNLDYAEIKNVDLIITPYFWEVNGKSGVKAYLKTMYVTLEEDVFAEKYARNTIEAELEGEIPFK